MSDQDLLLEMLLTHKLDFVREFIRGRLPISGTRADLRSRIIEALEARVLRDGELVSLLDEIEGWGDQHIYLYTGDDAIVAEWTDVARRQRRLKANKLEQLLDRPRPTLLPKSRKLTNISCTTERARFVWTERRAWNERLPERDQESPDEQIEWRAYKRRTARGTIAFEIDLVSGHAMMLIQQLPSGTDYSGVRDQLIEQLQGLVDFSHLQPLRLSNAIINLRRSGDVDVRKHVDRTPAGGGASFTSASADSTIADDPHLNRAVSALGSGTRGYLGTFYWLPEKSNRNLTARIRTTLYAKDQRVGIFGERHEAEVRYVVARIRVHC